jgi:hypothetical protein
VVEMQNTSVTAKSGDGSPRVLVGPNAAAPAAADDDAAYQFAMTILEPNDLMLHPPPGSTSCASAATSTGRPAS